MSKVNVWIRRMFFAFVMMAVIPFGCASNIEYPPLKQAPISEGPHAPNETIVRLRECVEEYGGDLGGRGFEFHYNVKVDEDGRVVDVRSDVFHVDFNGCTRAALRAMEVPPELLLTWMGQPLARREGQTNASRGLVGNLVIVGVTIVLADIIIEAGGVTVLFAITLALADEVIEAIRRRPPRNRCLDAAAGGQLMWEEFCRALPVERRRGCWEKTYESEDKKRNWCNEEFGAW